MTTDTLAQLLLAVCLATSVNALIEPLHLRVQLRRLGSHMDGSHVPRSKVHIQPTIIGSFLFGIFAIGLLSCIFYFGLFLIPLTPNGYIYLSIIVITTTELINRMQVDRLHAAISTLKDRFR